MGARIGVVTNPNSGKNRRRQGRRAELERAAGGLGIVRETRDTDALVDVIDEFYDAGCEYWVADGGDGTLHWLLSVGYDVACRRGGDHPLPLPKIVPANGGSIDFVAHKVGINAKAPEVVRALADLHARGESPPLVQLDTLRIEAGEHRRVGFAAALGGVAQRFFHKLYDYPHIDGWAISKVLAKAITGAVAGTAGGPLRSAAGDLVDFGDAVFAPTRAHVELDGAPLAFDSFASLQVGSIDINLGGVVRTFRHAAQPGVLHVQAVDLSPLQVAANLPNIVMGTPLWGDNVYDGPMTQLRAKAFDGESLDPVIDGELLTGLDELVVGRGPSLDVAAVCT